MNIEQYIQSGILEAYALGICTTAEQEEVERLSAQHPTLKSALHAIFADVEKMAMAAAVAPPPELKAKVMAAIDREAAAAQTPPPPKGHAVSDQAIKPTPSRLGYFLAGLAFALCAVAIWFMQGRMDGLRNELAASQAAVADCETRNGQLQDTERQLALIGNKSTSPILLSALPGQDETLQALVYHNPTEGVTLLNTAALPAPPSGKSWQLWAIVDGTPQSMGVIPDVTTDLGLQTVPFIATAQAFAISLEPEGGSETPTDVVMLGTV